MAYRRLQYQLSVPLLMSSLLFCYLGLCRSDDTLFIFDMDCCLVNFRCGCRPESFCNGNISAGARRQAVASRSNVFKNVVLRLYPSSSGGKILDLEGTSNCTKGVEEVLDRDESPVDRNNFFRMRNGTIIELFPHSDSTHFQWNNSSRRKLGDFLGCAFCKCCSADQTYCQSSIPCCYSINCDSYPFGFCKFVPVSCNCQGCGY